MNELIGLIEKHQATFELIFVCLIILIYVIGDAFNS